jgi:hypothetical protein
LIDTEKANVVSEATSILGQSPPPVPPVLKHSLTLYRNQTSGALVFGAHSVPWSWGLDSNHDIVFTATGKARHVPADPFADPDPDLDAKFSADLNVQQAMVNLLADMGVQPGSLRSQDGLVPATASTDVTPPTSTIISPADGASVPVGTPLTVIGTAADSDGGVVAGVEVSTDGGSWRRAIGYESFSYNFTPDTPGSLTIRSRAVDDSANLETPSQGITVTVI